MYIVSAQYIRSINDAWQHYMSKQNWNNEIRRQLVKMQTCRAHNKVQGQHHDRSRDQHHQDLAHVPHLLYWDFH